MSNVTIQGKLSTGKVKEIGVTGNAAHMLDQSLALTNRVTDGTNTKTVPTDVLPVWYNNVQASANYASVLAAEVTEIDMTLANHSGKTIAPTALVVTCFGGAAAFKGFLVSINTASTTTAATAFTTAAAPTSANVAHHKDVYYCPPGVTLIPYNVALGLVHVLALDTDASESNAISVAPL